MMKKITNSFSMMALIAVFLLSACKKDKDPVNNKGSLPNTVILAWNDIAFEALGGKQSNHALLASRVFALVHVAMHDAVNATNPTYGRYAYIDTDKSANPEVAAASAAHQVLKTIFPNKVGFLDSALNVYLSSVSESPAKSKGVNTGIAAANALLALGHNTNGAENPVGFPPAVVKPGDYEVVAPFTFIFAPFWKASKPFVLISPDQFRSAPHPEVSSEEYADAFNEVKQIGFINSITRNEDQTAFAKYWYEESQFGWNRIARVIAQQRKTELFATARLFALMHMAIADSYVAGWDSKLHYNFWRPRTAIRAAANDGNDATGGDLNWESLEVNPPIQDYPSTHSVLGNAGATVLALIYGDATPFTMESPTGAPGSNVRSFTSFREAANENADSRVMAGIHFRFSCNAGLEMGEKIGKWTIQNYLKPLN